MSKRKAGVDHGSDPADPKAAGTDDRARSTPDFVTVAATIGVITAGVALLEVALVPGLVIGGAAVLAPRYLPKHLPKYLPRLRRRLRPIFDAAVGRPSEPAPGQPGVRKLLAAPARLGIKQAVAKTITFRIIVTALDFTSNYVVLGEAATAAGLSSVTFVVGPIFYLVHETGWNYFSPSETVDLKALRRPRPDGEAPFAAGTRTDNQSGAGQDDHVSDHRHGDGLYDDLRGGGRSCHRGGFIGLRLRGRAVCVYRSRESLGLF